MLEQYFSEKDLYSPCLGIENSKLAFYNEYIHIHAKLFFKILSEFNLEFYVFAGTSVGYVRNRSNVPWVDDYDILIFEKDIDFFEMLVVPYLIKYGFIFKKVGKPCIQGGCHILSKRNKKFFQCDVFYSKICKDNVVKNLNGWGLYNKKNIKYDMIYPAQFLEIDGLRLPFFNKIEEDVMIEYGDVINNCCIYVDHKADKKIKEHFQFVYNEFYSFLEKAKNNTYKYVLTNKEYKYENTCVLDDEIKLESIFQALNHINKNNVKTLHITNQKFLEYCLSIKHYFKEIKIIFYMLNNIESSNLIFLNYVDVIKCKKEIAEVYKNKDVYIKNKPEFYPINVITFGTYDLFHEGHHNILKRAKSLGDSLIVGVSSDELNNKKGKASINKLEKRIEDVKKTGFVDCCFTEESLEKKEEYMKEYNADMLVMGDDWRGEFNWISFPCIYLPRTPGISTTQLKEKIKK